MAVYSVPMNQMESFKERKMIVRSEDLNDLAYRVQTFKPAHLEGIRIRISDMNEDFSSLVDLQKPIEIVIRSPGTEFPLLYRYLDLSQSLPVQVIVPMETPGFTTAVKVALSLGFPVRLQLGQPDGGLLEELTGLLDFYLHSAMATAPVDFFHSLFVSLYHGQPTTLWDIQHENPAAYRFVTRDGSLGFAKRIPLPHRMSEAGKFLAELEKRLSTQGGECASCYFLKQCIGFFKMPDSTFSCGGILRLLDMIREGVYEFKQDLDALAGLEEVDLQTLPGLDVRAALSGKELDPADCSGEDLGFSPARQGLGVIFCTFECNNACLFCAAEHQKGRNPPDLDARVFDFISRSARERFDALLFSGAGEPMLNESLEEYVKFANMEGITNLWLTTNGSNMSRRKIYDLYEAGISGFCVSLHGIGEVHDFLVRRQGSFLEAMDAIGVVSDAGLTRLDVNTCLTTTNIESLGHVLRNVGSLSGLNTHILSQPELEGAAQDNKEIICRLRTLKEYLRPLASVDYQNVILENIPHCVAPHLPHRPNRNTLLLLREDGSDHYANSLYNVGRNRLPSVCAERQCMYLDECCGVDAAYLDEHGDEEIAKLLDAIPEYNFF